MIRKFLSLTVVLSVFAFLGILSGIYMLILDQQPVPYSLPITPPSISPFESFISGAGIVEAASENIGLGTPVGGTIDNIFVKEGDIVPKGQPLFSVDSRRAAADLKTKQAELETAKTAVEQAKASLKLAQDSLNLINLIDDKRGVTKEEIITRQDNVTIAQKALENAQASVVTAQAQVDAAQTNLDLYTIKAPIECEIMQSNIHLGEYAAADTLSTPLMLVGRVDRYHIRTDIDENDAWRFNKNAPAIAFLRGNIEYHTKLRFEYIEPYIVPKKSLTGDSSERVDTRVLQVIYSYDPKDMPSYLGQQVDVFIEAPKVSPHVKYGGPLPVLQ